MSNEFKVLKLKDLAKKLGLISAKQFEKTEDYLEYAIKEIELKTILSFQQYLYLMDTLYVIVKPKEESSNNNINSPKVHTELQPQDKEDKEDKIHKIPPPMEDTGYTKLPWK